MAHRSLAFAGLLVCCAPAESPRPQTEVPVQSVAGSSASFERTAPRPAPGGLVADALPNAGWQQLVSRRSRFVVRLPDAASWRELPDERWLSLRHDPSRSVLRLRTWRAGPRVTNEECREQVYLWRGDLRPSGDPVLERSLAAPEGYDVELRVDLVSADPGEERAVALAYGASVRRCYAASFETEASVSDEAALGARLGLVVDGVLNRVRIVGLEELPSAD